MHMPTCTCMQCICACNRDMRCKGPRTSAHIGDRSICCCRGGKRSNTGLLCGEAARRDGQPVVTDRDRSLTPRTDTFRIGMDGMGAFAAPHRGLREEVQRCGDTFRDDEIHTTGACERCRRRPSPDARAGQGRAGQGMAPMAQARSPPAQSLVRVAAPRVVLLGCARTRPRGGARCVACAPSPRRHRHRLPALGAFGSPRPAPG